MPTMFNLQYDGGIFIGLYDGSSTATGVEPFPAGTVVTWPCKCGKKVMELSGTIILVPMNSTSPSCAEDTASMYVVQFSNGLVQ